VLLVQIAHRAGAQVIAAAGGPGKLDLVRKLGAGHAPTTPGRTAARDLERSVQQVLESLTVLG
jgi:NADPH:quinone reductase-like Zn-dependent oxidoreductase